jgi:hypothetical protein
MLSFDFEIGSGSLLPIVSMMQTAEYSERRYVLKLQTQFEKLAMYSWSAPRRVFLCHPPDSGSKLGGYLWSAEFL